MNIGDLMIENFIAYIVSKDSCHAFRPWVRNEVVKALAKYSKYGFRQRLLRKNSELMTQFG